MFSSRSVRPDHRGFRRFASLVGFLCVLLVACSGRKGPRRVPVQGNVTLGGTPIENASISFLPATSNHGPATMAIVMGGRYRLNRKQGPCAGLHKVVVLRDANDKKAFLANRGGHPVAEVGDRQRWEFEVVVPEKGPFEFDLALD